MKWPRFARFLKLGLALITLCVAGLSVWLRIEQYRFRQRAEALLADMDLITVGKTSEANVKKIGSKWSYIRYDSNRGANTYVYHLEISNRPKPVADTKSPYPTDFELSPAAGRLEAILGNRGALISASIEIRDGAVSSKSIMVLLETSPEDNRRTYLMAWIEAPPRESLGQYLWPSEVVAQRLSHPEYVVQSKRSLMNADTGGTSFAKLFSVQITRQAESSDVDRLSRFQLDCLTRFSSCTLKDLMPAAWAQWTADQALKRDIPCTAEVQRAVASFADYSGIFSADAPAIESRYDQGPPWTLKGVSLATSVVGPRLRHHGELELGSPEIPKVAGTDEQIRSGERYIFLIQNHVYGGRDGSVIFPCGVLKLNKQNLELAGKAAGDTR